ncbi:uncharacterized protein LOC133929878 [Phragmites australis]|uniref:uncharacterized protein LOC133929878 n=1 Tax=Phragmites australis TaxID=29695 RepID=UPI002D770017|nr:uncharacterized protein LOC133929878 [Phragmites australis]
MQGSLSRVHAFSPACVHAIERSNDGLQHPSHRSAVASKGEESSKKINNKRVTKLLLLLKPRWSISQAFRSLSRRAKNEAANNMDADRDDESDVETFVSANSSELRSFCTDNDDSELPSFHLSSLIFPTGSLERPPVPASPMKIVQTLPFGYVIGRQPDAPALPPTLARNIKKVLPMMAALHLRSRSQMVKKNVVRALKETFRRGRRGGAEEGDGCGDDEDVFWKKDVRGLRCRRVEDDGAPY